jgi:hypothetical protein
MEAGLQRSFHNQLVLGEQGAKSTTSQTAHISRWGGSLLGPRRCARYEREKLLNAIGLDNETQCAFHSPGFQVENPAEGAYNPYQDESQVFLNHVSIACRRWCSHRAVLRVLHAAVLLLLLLTFIEPPRWCEEKQEGCEALLHLQGTPAGGRPEANEVTLLYPSTQSMFLTSRQSKWAEALCLSVIVIVVAARIGRDGLSLQRYLRQSAVQINRTAQIVCLLLMALGILASYTAWNPYLRMMMAITFVTTAQRELQVLIGMLPVRTLVGLGRSTCYSCLLMLKRCRRKF